MNGFGRSIYQDGRCHIGYNKNHERNGYGKKFYASGNKYYGYFKDGLRSGYGIFLYPNGNSEEGYSIEDKLNGFAKVTENGEVKQGIYKLLTDGRWINPDIAKLQPIIGLRPIFHRWWYDQHRTLSWCG